MSRTAAALSLIAAMMFTGANVPFGKLIIAEMPIYTFIAFRFLVASLALALLVRGERGPRLGSMSRGQWGDLVVLGLVGSLLFTAFILEGTKRTSATEAGIITATIPAAVAILGLVFFRRRSSPGQICLIALAVAGLAVMQAGQAVANPHRLLGNVLVGCAVFCEASFVVVSQRMSLAFRPIRLSLGVSLMGFGLSLPLAVWEIWQIGMPAISSTIWLLALWYALSSSVFCTILWYRGAGFVEPWMAGLATAALPVTAVVISTSLLGEPLTLHRTMGAAMVVAALMAGALLTGRQPARPRPAKTEQGGD
ncbi:MAG TPA: DMT family transporter [Hyphomicrobiaceae bacterium]|nr:DMT family transporter [Hyphomicrobiaceae bacterium]